MSVIKVFAFDAYGTLFDVHSAVARNSAILGEQASRLSDIWRTKQLEYTWTRTAMGQYRDFWQLTCEALDFALAVTRTESAGIRTALLEAYRHLDTFDEAALALATLKAAGAQTAILSNGTGKMLEEAVASAGIGEHIDVILSVDHLRRYKTDPSAYQLVCDKMNVHPGEVSFQSSNRWDIAGAKAFGFRTVWINRRNQPDEYADLPPDIILADLAGLSVG